MTKTLLPKQYSPTREDILNALGAVSEIEYNKMWRSLDEKTKDINELVQKMHILEKKLEIATKVFKDITLAINMPSRVYMFNRSQQALKEMESVK